jgi:hypothetical protein
MDGESPQGCVGDFETNSVTPQYGSSCTFYKNADCSGDEKTVERTRSEWILTEDNARGFTAFKCVSKDPRHCHYMCANAEMIVGQWRFRPLQGLSGLAHLHCRLYLKRGMPNRMNRNVFVCIGMSEHLLGHKGFLFKA